MTSFFNFVSFTRVLIIFSQHCFSVPFAEDQSDPEVGGGLEGAGLSGPRCLVCCPGGKRSFPQVLSVGVCEASWLSRHLLLSYLHENTVISHQYPALTLSLLVFGFPACYGHRHQKLLHPPQERRPVKDASGQLFSVFL